MKFSPSKMSMSELNERALILSKIQIAIWSSVIIFSALLMLSPKAKADCDEIYLKVGAGYKFDEQDKAVLDGKEYYYTDVSPYSARIETGVECGNLTLGVSHHSQWATGVPFNDSGEYYKTEFFIDYKFSWGI